MGIKSLFFTDDSAEEKPKEEKKEPVSFPEATPAAFPDTKPAFTAPVPEHSVTSANQYYDDVLAVYEKGLEGLNQEGIEFYELYKAVEAVDINNASAYKMAFTMLNGADKTFTKEKALSTSQHYVDNIIKAYNDFAQGGISKREKLQGDKATEASTLNTEIGDIQSQLDALNIKLTEKKTALATIDSKYQAPLNEVEGKLKANEMAKDTIIGRLKTVIENIKINL